MTAGAWQGQKSAFKCPSCSSFSSSAISCSNCGYVFAAPPPASASRGSSRTIKWHFLAHLLWLLVPLYFYGRLLQSGAYLTSLDLAESSPLLQEVLGRAIHAKGFPIGSALPRYGSDFAEWSITLEGSRGSGRLFGVANSIGGEWEFSRLTLVPSNGQGKIDLTPMPHQASLAANDRKTVYLVPLEPLSEDSLKWAPAYYKALFGVDVRLLEPIALSASEEDQARHQLVAEKCVDHMVRSHPDLADDPSAILIAVTSRDMFISDFDWKYAENLRLGGHLAIVSAARLQPTDYPGKWNEELLNSRLQKMITKNLAILYFNLPLSNDYTSLASAGVLSGEEVDYMTTKIIGAEGQWDPFPNAREPVVTITVSPGKPIVWDSNGGSLLRGLASGDFSADLAIGLFTQRKVDFYFDDDAPLEFTRVYRNGDDTSRPFGIGANDSLDIFLVGRMEYEIDLVNEGGGRVHFVHVDPKPGDPPELYRARSGPFIQAVYNNTSSVWRVTSKDGWTYLFPYRPQAPGMHVTVLTGFIDPKGREYKMVRNDAGDLLSVTTPSGKWLHFEYDGAHRIRSIADSRGRTVQYIYDSGGRLIRVIPSDGDADAYTYNDRNQMVTAAYGSGRPFLINRYTSSNLISDQILSDGRHFEYSYTFGTRMTISQSLFKDPSGLITYFDYRPNGYVQSLPAPPPQ